MEKACTAPAHVLLLSLATHIPPTSLKESVSVFVRTLRAFFLSRFASCRSLLYFSLRTTLFLMNDVRWPAVEGDKLACQHFRTVPLLPLHHLVLDERRVLACRDTS